MSLHIKQNLFFQTICILENRFRKWPQLLRTQFLTCQRRIRDGCIVLISITELVLWPICQKWLINFRRLCEDRFECHFYGKLFVHKELVSLLQNLPSTAPPQSLADSRALRRTLRLHPQRWRGLQSLPTFLYIAARLPENRGSRQSIQQGRMKPG